MKCPSLLKHLTVITNTVLHSSLNHTCQLVRKKISHSIKFLSYFKGVFYSEAIILFNFNIDGPTSYGNTSLIKDYNFGPI